MMIIGFLAFGTTMEVVIRLCGDILVAPNSHQFFQWLEYGDSPNCVHRYFFYEKDLRKNANVKNRTSGLNQINILYSHWHRVSYYLDTLLLSTTMKI